MLSSISPPNSHKSAYKNSEFNANVIVINWTALVNEYDDAPKENGNYDQLVAKLPAIGQYIAYVIEDMLKRLEDYEYDVFNIELVTDNIAAQIAHISMWKFKLLRFLALITNICLYPSLSPCSDSNIHALLFSANKNSLLEAR